MSLTLLVVGIILFIGLVVNEYLDEYHRGDFLIRNLLAADPRSGSISVGALPRMGQTVPQL